MKSKIIIFILLVIVFASACAERKAYDIREKTQSQSKVEAEIPAEISTIQSKKVEFNITILNEARENNVEIEVRNEDNQLITKIAVASKKEFYNLDEGSDVSNPSFKDSKITLTNKEQALLVREDNEGISETYHFDPKNGGTIIISYYPPGRNENGVIQSKGKLLIRQQKGSVLLL